MNERPASTRPRYVQLLLWFALLLSLLALFGGSFFGHVESATNPLTFTDDVRRQIYPFFRFEDPELLADDYAASYVLALVPIGFRALYTVAGICASLRRARGATAPASRCSRCCC